MIKERHISDAYHTLLVVVAVTSIYIFVQYPPTPLLCFLLFIWSALLVLMGGYRLYLFRKINRNFRAILSRHPGRITKGSLLFCSPPQLEFDYQARRCLIQATINANFQLLLECVCRCAHEVEMQIMRPKKRDPKHPFVMGRYVVTGADQGRMDQLIARQTCRQGLSFLLDSFDHIFFQRNGLVRVDSRYDSSLTEPKKVYGIFDAIIHLIKPFDETP